MMGVSLYDKKIEYAAGINHPSSANLNEGFMQEKFFEKYPEVRPFFDNGLVVLDYEYKRFGEMLHMIVTARRYGE